jgi:Putative zinc-finger
MSEQGCTRPELGDLLSAYEMGLLDAPDQLRFESHLEGCSTCAEDLYSGAVASEEMRANPGRYAAAMNAAAGSVEPTLWDRAARFFGRFLQPRVLAPVGAVAAIALLLMVFQPGGIPSSADLALIDPLPYQGLQLRGGPGQDLDQLLAAGMEQYAAGNYEAAAGSLASVWEAAYANDEWSDRHQTALFLGLSLLLDERPDEAIRPLQAATEAMLLPIAERGTWYLAQAHLLREDPRASLPLLESLLNSPVYGVPAETQLHSVREICDNSHEG